jgi:hypothetical protein
MGSVGISSPIADSSSFLYVTKNMTSNQSWTDEKTTKALEIWADYQLTHDLADHHGEAVGIDPLSGKVWFGESAKAIVLRLKNEGFAAPLFFLRVGQDYYARKGSAK